MISRSHNAHRVGSPQEVLPRGQVNLAQGPAVLRLIDVVKVPHGLRVVADKVLRACTNALLLDAVHDGSGQQAREQGVLAEALKVPAAAGIAVDVDGRAEHDLRALQPGLLGELGAHLLEQLHVPCRGETGGAGKAGGGHAAVDGGRADSIDGVADLRE